MDIFFLLGSLRPLQLWIVTSIVCMTGSFSHMHVGSTRSGIGGKQLFPLTFLQVQTLSSATPFSFVRFHALSSPVDASLRFRFASAMRNSESQRAREKERERRLRIDVASSRSFFRTPIFLLPAIGTRVGQSAVLFPFVLFPGECLSIRSSWVSLTFSAGMFGDASPLLVSLATPGWDPGCFLVREEISRASKVLL